MHGAAEWLGDKGGHLASNLAKEAPGFLGKEVPSFLGSHAKDAKAAAKRLWAEARPSK